jgi:hypothetical protein
MTFGHSHVRGIFIGKWLDKELKAITLGAFITHKCEESQHK